jgi:glycosyltransferase involved in cell wall biosynthesis
LQLVREPRLQAALGAEAAHRALRFTWDVTADEVARVYRELLAV